MRFVRSMLHLFTTSSMWLLTVLVRLGPVVALAMVPLGVLPLELAVVGALLALSLWPLLRRLERLLTHVLLSH